MKVYTEEQVKQAIKMALHGFGIGGIEDTIEVVASKLTPIELPSDEEIEPVKALEEDSDWYLIPNKLCDEFKNDTYNEEMVESGGFDDKWWKYKTGGDLNLIQLYVKIQGGSK